ncbi:MAG: monooxygenase [Rhodospirillaceae bacterium]|jgi:2-polyprenyl-6-methoxyphenol hydroxylase-like FAD-dependent oxidoreductase|nr:monooxygenase [Rhodospirillaceae bacterium]MBT3883951.1 monooxygenase [Rhodospirillaceae bacterium]MBT4117703.1 monooxygenase [Rhodospirillaceae bacterium]MBT4674460.1 monooxygenase [Rhodospirillaceae bacterium]MBT4751158.1 monooxygenase [Rhodospirillaceae bacterium]
MEKRHQVIIIGGGPVGIGLAVELGLRGISCAVVEQRVGLHRIPKGQNLTQRTLERFYFWGIVDELRDARVMPAAYSASGVTAYKNLMSEHWYAPQYREIVNSYYFQNNDRMPQYQMEEVLRAKVASLSNVEVQFGWKAETIEQDDNGVRVTITEEGGSGSEILEADYVVGCDGAHSTVRQQIGIERTGSDFDQIMVLAVFRSKELHEGLKRFPEISTYRVLDPELKGYWQFFGRIDVGEGWFFHAPVPADTTRDNFDFEALIQKAAGFECACEFDHVGFWDLRVAVADTYQVGRALIAGDAAHSHPPYGGYGLNNGLEDVANLGWKLAAKLDGWGSDALLRTYSEERHPIFKETGEDFIAARIEEDHQFLDRYNPDRDKAEFERAWEDFGSGGGARVKSYEPNYEGSSVIDGPPGSVCSAHGSHTYTARAGHHLPPQPLSSGKNVFEELGPGFTLLALGSENGAVQAFVQAAGAKGIPLKVIEDSYDGGREAYEKRLILVRPDQYVVWTGDEGSKDADALMSKVSGHASP